MKAITSPCMPSTNPASTHPHALLGGGSFLGDKNEIVASQYHFAVQGQIVSILHALPIVCACGRGLHEQHQWQQQILPWFDRVPFNLNDFQPVHPENKFQQGNGERRVVQVEQIASFPPEMCIADRFGEKTIPEELDPFLDIGIIRQTEYAITQRLQNPGEFLDGSVRVGHMFEAVHATDVIK
jgi:hypothetical protein